MLETLTVMMAQITQIPLFGGATFGIPPPASARAPVRISASHKGWGDTGSPCQHSPRGPARCPSQASDRFQPSHLRRTSPKNAIRIHAIPPQNPEGVSALVISIFLLVCSQKQSKCKNNQKTRSGRAKKSLEKGQAPRGSPRDVIPEEREPHGRSCPAPA